VRLERFDTPLMRRALIGAFVAFHVLGVIGPADVLAPVDPWRIGRMLWHGHVPYRDFALEYPPGSVLAFLLPGAVPHGLARHVLALQAVAAELAVMWFVLRRYEGALWRWLPLSILVFPFLSGGFDVLPMAAIAGSTALLAGGSPAGWWLAGLGALLKLTPGAAWVWARSHLAVAAVALAATAVLLLGPVLLAHHSDDAYIGYSLHRGVQIESLGASTTWLAHEVTGRESTFVYRFKSWEIGGADATAAGWAVLGIAGLAVVALKAGRRGPADPWLAAFTTLVLLLLANKVLSPQFIAWPAPLAAVLGGRWFRAWMAIAAVTLAAYLVDGPTWILACAAVRNVGLVLVAAAGLRELWLSGRPCGPPETAAGGSSPPPGTRRPARGTPPAAPAPPSVRSAGRLWPWHSRTG
jgi:hypothetical protein